MARAIDPVCGMTVDTDTAVAKATYRCAAAFRADPERYVGAERHEPPFTKSGGITAPKFGAAGSGGAEYEQLPERHRRKDE